MVSILKGIAGAMQVFKHDGFDLAFIDHQPKPDAEPVLMIHGFASSHMVNWVSPGWVKTLTDAGYRAIAFDNRGHGASTRSYNQADYAPQKMAGDAAALADRVRWAAAHPAALRTMGENALARFERDFSPNRSIERLVDIYETALAGAEFGRRAAALPEPV